MEMTRVVSAPRGVRINLIHSTPQAPSTHVIAPESVGVLAVRPSVRIADALDLAVLQRIGQSTDHRLGTTSMFPIQPSNRVTLSFHTTSEEIIRQKIATTSAKFLPVVKWAEYISGIRGICP
jgi:hypothetical protein